MFKVCFDAFWTYLYGWEENYTQGPSPGNSGSRMGSFGEDLRSARMSRGIALEDITAITKISLHYLQALEQDRFRSLPGGILNKGIVRGYASAVGLEPQDWTERFMQAYSASGQVTDEDRNWTAFATNVGRARIQRRETMEFRIRWAVAVTFLLLVAACAFLLFRYCGMRLGWWTNLLPASPFAHKLQAAYLSAQTWVTHLAG